MAALRALWNVVRLLIAGFVLWFAYTCAQVSGIADRPVVPSQHQAAAVPPTRPAPATPECSPAAFAVQLGKARREYDNIIFAATVTNTGKADCGVQLKISSYDKAGGLLDTKDFWPASVRNIAPGASENFTVSLRFDKATSQWDVVPISARTWRN